MSEMQTDQEVEELVEFLVRKKVSKQVLKKVVQQIEAIEHQEAIEKRSSKLVLPVLVALAAMTVILLVLMM